MPAPQELPTYTDSKKRHVIWHRKNYYSHLKKHPDIKQWKAKIGKILASPSHSIKNWGFKLETITYWGDVERYNKLGMELRIKVVVCYQGYLKSQGIIKTAHLDTFI